MFFLAALRLSLIFLQSVQVVSSDNALVLLNEVGLRYANAKAYHIEAVEEETSSGELHRDWRKTFMKAAVQPGGHYRYEGRFLAGDALLVSDGIQQWEYLPQRNSFTQTAVISDEADKKRIRPQEELAALNAKIDRRETRPSRRRFESGGIAAGRNNLHRRKKRRLLRDSLFRQRWQFQNRKAFAQPRVNDLDRQSAKSHC